jgi:hypothetical protein
VIDQTRVEALAHIWVRHDEDEWKAIALEAEVCALTPRGPSALPADTEDGDSAAVRIRRFQSGREDAWALLADTSASVLVNGLPVPHGLVVLADRDEITPPWSGTGARVESGTCFFSIERLAAVEPFPSDGRRGSCPRCKQPLTPGGDAVRCPGCGLWHHATVDTPCWSYAPTCAACDQATAFDAGFRWTPEEL